jgi:hypothetical protein|tara:strand:+ start:578 stop:769 length:192 start_codon:yes stop_codon:yes gene_type:complete
MIEFVLKIIRHVLLILYVSFLINLFVIGLFGEFVDEDKIALKEFLVVLSIFTPIYLSFLWGKK